MYIVPIAWLYVSLMMAVAEATNTNGTLLGAIVTFVLYGLLPIGLILYFMGSKGRRKAIRARELAEMTGKAAQPHPKAQPLINPDASSHSTTDAIAPVRKEP